jgi:hypothetical protein
LGVASRLSSRVSPGERSRSAGSMRRSVPQPASRPRPSATECPSSALAEGVLGRARQQGRSRCRAGLPSRGPSSRRRGTRDDKQRALARDSRVAHEVSSRASSDERGTSIRRSVQQPASRPRPCAAALVVVVHPDGGSLASNPYARGRPSRLPLHAFTQSPQMLCPMLRAFTMALICS